jgi:hypothetical protein
MLEISETGFPSQDRRTQKKGGKWMVQDVIYRGGPQGVELLAHAMPILMTLSGGDLEGAIPGPVPPLERHEQHEQMLTTVKDFFPIAAPKYRQQLENFDAEYRMMKTRQPRERVAEGKEAASAYAQALQRGEDPDQDPALVADQRRWARDFFISEATIWACRLVLDLDFMKLAEKTCRMSRMTEREGREEFRERMLDVWVRGTGSYMDYVRMDE